MIYTHVLEKSEIKREIIQLTVDRRRNVAYPHSILTGCTVSYSHPPSSFSSDTPACRLCTSSAGFNNEVFLTPSSILGKYNYIKVLKSGTNLMKCIFYLFFCRSIQDVKFSAVVVVVVTFIKWCLLIFLPFLHINYEGKRRSQETMKAYRWDSLLTLDLASTIVIN